MDYRVEKVMKIKEKYGFRVIVIFEDLTERKCQHSGFEKDKRQKKNVTRL